MDDKLIEFLEKEMNKYDLFYFVYSKENSNHIYAHFKSNGSKFCTFYIDAVKTVITWSGPDGAGHIGIKNSSEVQLHE